MLDVGTFLVDLGLEIPYTHSGYSVCGLDVFGKTFQPDHHNHSTGVIRSILNVKSIQNG